MQALETMTLALDAHPELAVTMLKVTDNERYTVSGACASSTPLATASVTTRARSYPGSYPLFRQQSGAWQLRWCSNGVVHCRSKIDPPRDR